MSRGSGHAARAALALLLAVAAAAWASAALGQPFPRLVNAVPGAVLVEEAEWILDPGDAPPPEGAAWRRVALPFRWAVPDPPRLERAWIRMRFELPRVPADGRLAVFMPKLGNGGTVWLNGVAIGDVVTMDEATQVRWFRPFLFPFRAELLRPGPNELVVRQQSRDTVNVLRGVVVGPLDPMRARHDWLLFWQHTTATIAAWFCLLFGGFLLMLWMRRRQEGLSAIFGAACLMWSLRSLSFVVEVIPLQGWFAWRTVYYVATGGFIALMAIGLVRFAGRTGRWGVPIALGYWALGPAVFVALGWPARPWLDGWWTLGFVPLMAWSVGHLGVAWWRERDAAQLMLLASVVAATAMALHDYLIGLDPSLLPRSSFYGMHLAAPLMLAALGLHLLDRFVRTLKESETLARDLEQRVAERERDLAANFARLRALERERTLADERQRIMREMHDGVGSQLLSSLAMVERGAAGREDIARMLRECLDDMRLAIDTLTPDSADLAGALGNLRFRFTPRFEAMGIATRWNLASLPDPVPVTPHQSLQLLRIVQEAFANVLKHAQARSIAVEAVVSGDTLTLEVVDDGVGFDPAVATPGRGLRNMQRRAAAAGAGIEIGPGPAGGTRVRITRRLAPDAEAYQGDAP